MPDISKEIRKEALIRSLPRLKERVAKKKSMFKKDNFGKLAIDPVKLKKRQKGMTGKQRVEDKKALLKELAKKRKK